MTLAHFLKTGISETIKFGGRGSDVVCVGGGGRKRMLIPSSIVAKCSLNFRWVAGSNQGKV